MAFQRAVRAAAAALLSALAACAAEPGLAREDSAPGAIVAIRAAARPVTGSPNDHDEILAAAAGARRILLGESTHGTHEYYRERARITERLVREQGVRAIAIEGDWSPTWRVNLYVRGLGSDTSAAQALQGYTNFPRWMWGNEDFRDLVERLRAFNLTRPPEDRVGLYGMDVYDLFAAADSVLAYLREAKPAAAAQARKHYACFSRHGRSTHAYGEAARHPKSSCRAQAEAVLAEVRRLPRPEEPSAAERRFAAVRSAASVAAAEEYFRTVYAGSLAWNVRDQHMAQNVEEIADYAGRLSGRPARIVVWGHNTHSGDARATFAADRGELNLGQLMRQKHGQDAFLVGFLSHSGTVTAAPEWDEPGRTYDMRPALSGSYSATLHEVGVPAFSLLLRGNRDLARALEGPKLERAIGVVYQPASERLSHYFEARLPDQFDAILYFDKSRAVVPLRR